MFITPAQAPEFIMDTFKAGLVPMFTSSPGIGKSSIARQIADEQNLKLIDIRLAQCDPTDLNGFPYVDKALNKATYLPMDIFPIENDSLPLKAVSDEQLGSENTDNYDGWFLLLDEFNSAPMAVQAAAYKIVLDRKIGQYNLHKNVVIMCAGNLDTDKAIVNRLSTAMQSRMIHFQLEADVKDWLKWANNNSIDHRIMAWISFKNEALHNFDPDHSDKTFPCPRTWEFLSKIIKPWKTVSMNKMPLVAGTVGEGMANEFIPYCSIFEDIPTIQEIMRNPKGVDIPEEPSILYAISFMVAKHIKETTVDTIIQMIDRLPIEFQITCLNNAVRKNIPLADCSAIVKWRERNVGLLLD